MFKRIILEPVPEDDLWRLVRRVSYGEYGIVGAGFKFDGGSVPPAARPVAGCPLDPRKIRGYLIHDWLYYRSRLGHRPFTRKQADELMRDLHIEDGTDPIIAAIIYRGVRLGASYTWMTKAEIKARHSQHNDEDFLS